VENRVLPDKFSSDDDKRMAGKTNRNDEKAALGQIRTGTNYFILCWNEPLFKGIRFMQISAPEERKLNQLTEQRRSGYIETIR
jgi:hypothetical protein